MSASQTKAFRKPGGDDTMRSMETKRDNSPDQKHSVYSPSSATRWMECPSSPRLVQVLREQGRIPPDSDNDASRRGTFLHELTSLWLEGKWDEAEEMAKRDAHKHGEGFDDAMHLASEAAGNARKCLYIWEEKVTPDVHLEKRYEVFEPLHIHGTADVSRVSETEVNIVDFKFGAWRVHAEDNVQLAIYAYLASENLRPGLAGDIPVSMTIIQPVLGAPDWYVDTWETTLRQVRRIVDRATEAYLIGEASYTGDSEPVYSPGEDQCKFCPARTHCPALAGIASKLAKEAPMITTMSAAEVATFYDNAKLVSGIKDRIEDEVRAGTITEGFTTKPGAKRETWAKYDSDEFQKLLEENDWEPDRIIDPEARLPLSKLDPELRARARELGAIYTTHNKERVARDKSGKSTVSTAELADAPGL